ncbi:hypothetical protein WDJ51_08065 [Rathayibacter sp. YIM 133350]
MSTDAENREPEKTPDEGEQEQAALAPEEEQLEGWLPEATPTEGGAPAP